MLHPPALISETPSSHCLAADCYSSFLKSLMGCASSKNFEGSTLLCCALVPLCGATWFYLHFIDLCSQRPSALFLCREHEDRPAHPIAAFSLDHPLESKNSPKSEHFRRQGTLPADTLCTCTNGCIANSNSNPVQLILPSFLEVRFVLSNLLALPVDIPVFLFCPYLCIVVPTLFSSLPPFPRIKKIALQ